MALRFARVLRYREDKTAAEADTISAVRALWHSQDDPGANSEKCLAGRERGLADHPARQADPGRPADRKGTAFSEAERDAWASPG